MKLIWGRRKAAEGEDEAKQYKKANLGESNKLYYHSELQMWVEKGKEEEARAAKAALSAPPPPASITPASSSTSLSATVDGAALQPPAAVTYKRGGSIKDRYIAQPVGTVGGSSGPPPGKGLLPGAAGVAGSSNLVPGLPKIPRPAGGALMPGAGTFFVPTPATSQAPSELGAESSTPGTMSLSQSGLSMDAFVPGSGPPSQPGMFAFDNGSSGKAITHKLGVLANGDQGTAVAADVHIAASATGHSLETGNMVSDQESSSGGTAPVVANGIQNLSFAAWQRTGSSSITSPGAAAKHAQQGFQPGAAVDEREVTSPAQQGMQGDRASHSQAPGTGPSLPWMPNPVADSNGHYAGHDSYGNGALSQTGYVPPAMDPEGVLPSAHGYDLMQASAESKQPISQAADLSVGSGGATPAAWTNDGTAAAYNVDARGENRDVGSWQQQPPTEQAYPSTSSQLPEHGWQDGTWAHDVEGHGVGAFAGQGVASTPEYNSQSAEGNGKQQDWLMSDNPPQQPHSNACSNGYHYSSNQQWQGSYQQTHMDQSWSEQQTYAANGVDYSGQSGSTDPASHQQPGDGSYSAYNAGSAHQQHHTYQQPQVLDPVHPQLPGIATTVGVKDEDGVALDGKQYTVATAPAAHAAYADAASRHYSAPGTAPHPSRTTSGGVQYDAWIPSSPMRSNSLQSPTRGSVTSLLPPARPSFNGSAGSPPKDSSALTMPATAVAGDSSLVTTVRPSSPYARPVSPLARTSACVNDLATDSKTATHGFPIPSPPTAALGRPGIFVPGNPTKQLTTSQQHMQVDNSGAASFGVANGYVGLQYASDQQQAFGGPGFEGSSMQQQLPLSPQDVASRSSSEKRTHFYDEFLQDSLSKVNWKLHPFKQPGKLNRLTPIEEFEMEQERQKQQSQNSDGRLDKFKRDPFYLKQMELRRKLPAAAVKPSISEPVILPSHVMAARAAAASPGDSVTSRASYITDWQQQRQQSRYQQDNALPVTPPRATGTAAAVHAVDGGSPEQEPTPQSKFVPLAAAAGSPAAAAGVPFATGMDVEPVLPEAAATAGGQAQYGNSYGVYTSQPQQELTAGASTRAAADEGVAEQSQQQAAAWPNEWSLCTQQQQQEWVQYYYPDYLPWLQDPDYQQWFHQAYNSSMQQWQEQQQSAANSEEQQQQHDAERLQQSEGFLATETAPAGDSLESTADVAAAVTTAGWGTDGGIEGGTGDTGVLDASASTQVLDDQAVAEVETAAVGWGEGVLAPETRTAPVEPTSDQSAATVSASAADAEAYIAEGMNEQAFSHSPRVSSSTGTASQPSTAKAAAAASKTIVSQALGKILQEHAAIEEAAALNQPQPQAATAAASDAWNDELFGADVTSAPAAAAPDEVQHQEAAALTAAGEGAWGDGWEDQPLEVDAGQEHLTVHGPASGEEDAEAQQQVEQGTVELPKDWQEMRQQVYAVSDSDGSLEEYKRCFVGWGDQFFLQAAKLWPNQNSSDASLAAALMEKSAELDQAAELFSEVHLQQRALAKTFDSGGFGIGDLLVSLEL